MHPIDFDFNVQETTSQRRLRALDWLFSISRFTQFDVASDKEIPEQGITIVETDQPILASACPLDCQVLTVSDSSMTCWYHPYSQPGAPDFSCWIADGLFGLMTGLIWHRYVGDACTRRFMDSLDLPPDYQVIADHHRAIQSHAAALTRVDILEYLRGKALPTKVFTSIHAQDVATLSALRDVGALAEVGISQDDLDYALPKLQSENKHLVKAGKHLLTSRILFEMASKDWAQGVYEGVVPSDESCSFDEQKFASLKTVSIAAREYYVGEFFRLATSPSVLRMEEEIFNRYRMDSQISTGYLSRLRKWVAEATRK